MLEDLAREVLDLLLVLPACLGGLDAQIGGGRVLILLLERFGRDDRRLPILPALNCRGISSLNDRKAISTPPMVPPAI